MWADSNILRGAVRDGFLERSDRGAVRVLDLGGDFEFAGSRPFDGNADFG